MHKPALFIPEAATLLKAGKVVAYPTEAVFGLGCCPHNKMALEYLIELKQRQTSKGLILIASGIDQLLPYIEIDTLPTQRWQDITATWPGPYTWVFPASSWVLPEIKGDRSTVAVRVSAHPVANALCAAFGGALVSTSANIASQSPLTNANEVHQQFGEKIAGIVAGEVGGALKPTTIQDAMSGEVYR